MKIAMALVGLILSSSTASAFELCQTKMENAAMYHMAQELGRSLKDAKLIRFEMGGWTEAMGNNSGSATATVRFFSKSYYVRISGKQIDTSSDCEVTQVVQVKADTLDPIALQAEKYKVAIGEALYMSEGDDTWKIFYSRESVDENFSEESLRQVLRSGDRPISVWSHKETIETLDFYANENPYENENEAYAYKRLKELLLKDFKEVRILKVGEEDSGTLYLYLVGRTADGRLVGLYTTVAET